MFDRYSELIPSTIVYELQTNLSKIINEGITNVCDRHLSSSRKLQSALENVIGLEMFVEKDCNRLPTIITVKMPVGINAVRFAKCLSER